MSDSDDLGELLIQIPDGPPDIELSFRWAEVPVETRDAGGYRALARSAKWEVTLVDGRTIRLALLHQWWTYAGVLCGLPYGIPSHESHINWAVDEATVVLATRRDRVHVLMPKLLRSKVKTTRGGRGIEEVEVEFLPPVCALGLFDSDVMDPAETGASSLGVVWFQDAFGPPELGHVTEQLRRVPWAAKAEDWSW